MNSITIRYPEDCTEQEAVLYAEGCFNPKQHDYRKERQVGKQNCTVMTYRDDRVALFYRTKAGYVLEIRERAQDKCENCAF